MSRNVLERVLHQLSVDRFSKQKFREDPEKFLERHALSPEERRMVLSYDVKALQAIGVNPMLTMGFWQEMSPDRSPAGYMRQLRPLAEDEAVHSAALKQ